MTLHSDRSRLARLVGLAAGAVVLVALLRLRDPHRHGSWGLCPVYALTGVYCPACGGLRAVNDLARGRCTQALHANALAVLVVIPAALGWWLVSVRDAIVGAGRRRLTGSHAQALIVAAAVAAVGFVLVRNTVGAAFLTP